jgi:outer membrane receptor protein involved in Fe transport
MNSRFLTRLRILTLCTSAAALPATAPAQQTAPSATSATTAANTEPVQLSPFQVISDDRGYQALNTLSGTRLNTKLEDLGSSITVVTKQQMLDTAVTDINDLFLYEANTEGTGNFTAFTANRDGGVIDQIQADPSVANRVRGLGSANTAIGNYVSDSRVPFDVYNVEAVEISRGPNSNIFGLGRGSGTVNLVPSTANAARSISSFSTRVDSFGGYRGSIDLNRPLIDRKLALRYLGLYENKGFELEPSREEIRRMQGSVFYRPFERTTLRATGEFYRNTAQRPNTITPRETITDWIHFGRPGWNPVTQTVTYPDGRTLGPFAVNQDANLPLGLWGQGNNFYNRTGLFIEPNGTVGHWSVNRVGNAATPLTRNQNVRFLQSGTELGRLRETAYPLFFESGITDKSLYDWSSINYVAPNRTRDKADTYTIELEQIVWETRGNLVAARLGWFRQDFERYDRSMISSNDTQLFVDVNRTLLDGTPNPYFGRPYVAGSWPTTLRTPNSSKTGAADLAYQFTPEHRGAGPRWFGLQRLNVHGNQRSIEFTNFRYRDFVTSNHAWISPNNRLNSTQTYFQYYLGDNVAHNVDYAPTTRSNMAGTYPLNWFNGVTRQWIAEPAALTETAIDGTSTTQRRIRTINATYQAFFLDDRVVTTVGFRRDRQQNRNSAGVAVDPATGFISYDRLSNFSNSPWLINRGDTKTFGVVVKPQRWVSVFYNYADSFEPLGTSYDIFGNVLPNPTSEGKDYGVLFTLLEGKFSLRVNRYDSTEINSRKSQIGTVGSRIHRLEGERQPYNESFLPWARNVALTRFQRQGVNPTQEQLFLAAAQIMQIDPEFLRQTALTGAVGVAADVTSKGWEFEATYNPQPNWRFKFTGAQQKAIDSNIGGAVTDYLAQRLPVWTTVADDNGNRWWDANNGAARVRYLADIRAPYLFEIANQGKPRSQVREWRWNALTNYDFTAGRLKGWSAGGAVRWQDKAAIGFRGRPPEDGMILELDPNRPIYDKARFAVDLNVGYRFRFAGDRVRGRVQLNVRDLFEDGRLQAVAANPDGGAYAFRIVEPRRFILTTSFDL